MAMMAEAKKKQPASAASEMLAKEVRMTREYSDWLNRLRTESA